MSSVLAALTLAECVSHTEKWSVNVKRTTLVMLLQVRAMFRNSSNVLLKTVKMPLLKFYMLQLMD